MQKLILSALLCVSAGLTAQSPLTTLFAQNNGGGNGWTMYFDVTISSGISFTQLDLNLYTGSVAGTVDMYFCPTTYVGNDTNAGAWTLGGSGPVTANPMDTPSPCVITPFAMAPGTYGIALVHNNVAPAYTNGNGPNQTYSNTELTLTAGASAGGGLGTAICCTPRVVNVAMHYTIASGSYATKTNFGKGCNESYAAFQESYAACDLSNTSLLMSNVGTGYVVLPGTTPLYVSTSAPIVMGDDQVVAFPLGWSLPYPGGTTNTLHVSSNGFIHGIAQTGSGCCAFQSAMFLTLGPCWAAKWRDLNPSAGGTVHFDTDPLTQTAYVTFNGVVDYATALPNTFQYAFSAAGTVEMRFGAMALTSGTTGWSPGTNNILPPSIDLTATPVILTGSDRIPLRLAGNVRPQLGATVTFTVSNIPATALLSAMVYGLTKHDPGIDLSVIGMSGCFQFASQDAVALLFTNPTATHAFTVPNNIAFAGVHVIAQGACYDPAGGHNTLGALSSNGVDLGIDIN